MPCFWIENVNVWNELKMFVIEIVLLVSSITDGDSIDKNWSSDTACLVLLDLSALKLGMGCKYTTTLRENEWIFINQFYPILEIHTITSNISINFEILTK